MAQIYSEPSRTFGEYLLIPNLTTKDCVPERVDLSTPVARFRKGETSALRINIPFSSALMQSVSGESLAIALARCGGLAFIFGSQSIESQARMVRNVKMYKAGFVTSDSNLPPTATLADVLALTAATEHSTIPITEDGSSNGRLVGMVTSRDYRPDQDPTTSVRVLMTPIAELRAARDGMSLEEANQMIWQHKLNCLPVTDAKGALTSLVFRKDHDEHRANPLENVDSEKRLIVGAGINSRDHQERVPALLEAGVDALCVDSSDGYSEWQAETLKYVKKQHGEGVVIGAGNVVDAEGFRYLADAGADFVKVGIGGGSICITREQKGIGRGQASSVIEVAKARDAYFQETGVYVPICSDGGITQDYHTTLALAMGADFLMLGRYFARFDESPGRRLLVQNKFVKEYWGEGSNRARNWQRYDMGSTKSGLSFEEGVDSYVPYAGKLKDNLDVTLSKLRSTLCNCGALAIPELQAKARLTVASAVSIHEGSAHDVMLKESDPSWL